MRLSAVLLGAALAGGCGQEGAEPAAQARVEGVTGSVSKGPLEGATVDFYAVDAAGNLNGPALVASVTTNASGGFGPVTGLPAGVPILVQTSGGSYVDESAPETEPPGLRRRITFGSADHLEAVLPPGATTLVITPYSMAMYKKAFVQAAGANFANVYAAVHSQAQAAFGFDPILTIPANPITGAGGSQEYAMLLGAAALAINQIAVTGTSEHLPGYADVIAFVNDFSDGQLGLLGDLDELVRRFRNNNIGVYGGSDAPVVDEAALSQPAVVPNTAPTISAIGDQSISEGGSTGALAFTIADSEDAAASLAVVGSSSNTSLVPNPAIVFGGSGASRTVTVTPAAGQSGIATITVTVTDTDSGSAAEAFLLTVNAVNDPPVINSSAPTTAIEDTLYTYNATVTDPDGPAPTWLLGAGHTCGGSIGAGSGVFTFTPAGPVPPASCVVEVQVSDGGSPVTQSTTVNISAVNDAPVINSTAPTTATEDMLFTYNATASDPDGPSQTWSLGINHNCGGSIVPATGVFTFTPAGPVPFVTCVMDVQVSDGGTPVQQTTVVAITAVNDAPTASNDSISLAEGGTATTLVGGATSVLANDSDPENSPLTAVLVSGPVDATMFLLNPDGTFTYLHNGSETATDSFTYKANDGGLDSNVATVTISISPVDDPPVAVDDLAATNEDVPVGIADTVLLANDTDVDGPSLAVTAVSNPVNGAVVLSAGTATFTPTADFFGTASFDYTVSDGTFTDTGSVTVTVNPVNDPPAVVANNPFAVNEGATTTITTANLSASDPDHASSELTYNFSPGTNGAILVNSLPQSFFTQLQLEMGFVAYAHDGSETLSDSFSFTVMDAGSPPLVTSPQTFSVVVTGINDAPSVFVPAGALSGRLFGPSAVPGLSVTDVDAGVADIQVELVADRGTLTVVDTAAVTETGNGTGAVTLTGPQADINGTLSAGITFDVSGPVIVLVTADDLGNSPAPAQQTLDSFTVNVNRVELGDLNGANGFAVPGEVAGDFAGRSVAGGGDFNGDGFDDYVIGAHQADPVSLDEGATYVVFGTAAGFPASVDLSTVFPGGFKVQGAAASDQSGLSIALAGDFNADGFDDLVIGATLADVPGPVADAGRVYIVFGRNPVVRPLPSVIDLASTSLNGPDAILFGGSFGSLTGVAVNYAGDVNGDGASELLIGAPGTGSGGSAYLVFGDQPFESSLIFFFAEVLPGPRALFLDSLTGPDGFILNGGAANQEAGRSVASAGDVNGDGLDDIVIGATQESAGGAGVAYVVFGGAGLAALDAVDTADGVISLPNVDGTTGFSLQGVGLGDRTGIAVAGGDLNGDGFSDIIVGADLADPPAGTDAGAAYVVFGTGAAFGPSLALASLDGSNGFPIAGVASGDNAGTQVAMAGDVNGDGLDDLLIGSSLADPAGATDAGAVSLVFGNANPLPPSFVLELGLLDGATGIHLNGVAAGDLTGSVAAGGDLNGDGFDDLHLGASAAGSGAGLGYAVLGFDFRGEAASVGNTSFVGTAAAENIIGSAASDALDGLFGLDAVSSGADDDFVLFRDGSRRLDGGGGIDTLFLPGVLLDLTGEKRYRDFEQIQLGGTGSKLDLAARDLNRASGRANSLRVFGTSSVLPVTSADAWVQRSLLEDIDGIPHVRYGHGHSNLFVQQDLDRSGIPVAFDWVIASRSESTPQGDGFSGIPVLSGDGQYVAYESSSTNLVSPPIPPLEQIYRTRITGLSATELISKDAAGNPGSGHSTNPAISYDGRFIAFHTQAPELGGIPGSPQVVMVDMQNPSSFRLISDRCGDACTFAATRGRITVSSDGRYVAFIGDPGPTSPVAPDTFQVWRADTVTGDVVAVSVNQPGSTPHCGTPSAPNLCHSATMSNDGRWIAWASANGTVPGDTNGLSDVYLRDMTTGELRLVSVAGPGTSAEPYISADGRRLAFESDDPTLIVGDTNGLGDIFIYDIATQSRARANTTSGGGQSSLGGVVNEADDGAGAPVLSGDGRTLMFNGNQSDLAPAVPFIELTSFVKRLDFVVGGNFAGEIQRGHLSRSAPATVFNQNTFGYSLDFSGQKLAMYTLASNVISVDTNSATDVFVAPNPVFVEDAALDSDGDGLTDVEEQRDWFTDPLRSDTDSDGLSDGDEVNVAFTNPASPDSDGDGAGDGLEVGTGSNPVGFNTVIRVSGFFGNDANTGATWDDNPPGSGPLQTNAAAVARLDALQPYPTDTAGMFYVLYDGTASLSAPGILDLADSLVPRQFVTLVGSVGPNQYVPQFPPTTPFNAQGTGRPVTVSNALNITLRNVFITGGSVLAPEVGGGVLLSDVDGVADLTLRQVHVTGNSAESGGGLAAVNGSQTLRVYDSLVELNTASSSTTARGGGIYSDAATLDIQNTTIADNTASGMSVGPGQGGGIWVAQAIATIDNSLIQFNSATSVAPGGGGGGIYVTGPGPASITVTDSKLIGNSVTGGPSSADQGGGGLNAATALNTFVIVDHSLLAANVSGNGPGAGINLINASAIVRDNEFLSNESNRPGAGLHAHVNPGASGPFDIINNLFVGNASTDADAEGAAIEIEHNAAVALKVNSNTAAYNQIVNNTSTGIGGGIAIFPSTAPGYEFSNNIVWFNDNATVSNPFAPEAGDNLFAQTPLTAAGNNVNESFAGNAATMPADPIFTQGFYLKPGVTTSIDAGDDAATGAAGLVVFPFTTDPLGSVDTAPVDIGFHHQRAGAGTFDAVNLETGSVNLCTGPQSVIFTPTFANAPNGEPGHLIVAEASLPGGLSLSSLTTLDPRASGSRIARDLGDGRYAVTIGGGLANNTGSFTIYADEQLIPQSFVLNITSPC